MAGNVTLNPLPTMLDGLSTPWLEAALQSWNPGITLNDSEILDVNHGTCTKVRVRLDLDEAGKAAGIPERVIVKGGFEAHSRMMPYMHKQEVHAYADVLPHTPLRFPGCWFAGFDAGAAQGIIIMEDLVARGVEFCHPQRPQTPEQVARRLSRLAQHHAMSWGGKDFEPGGRFEWAEHTGDSGHFESILVPDTWQGYIDSARGAAASVCFHDLDWMIRAKNRFNAFSKAQPPVLVHGDTHLGNLYIDIDGEPGFFDSLPHKSAFMQEVSYHVTGALDVPDRRAHERELVAHYRYELAAHGAKDIPPLDELMRQFGIFLANGYMIFIVNASEFQPEAINTAYTARYSSAMLDHDTIGLLEGLGD